MLAAALLDAWEQGREASPGERGLYFLQVAQAPATREALSGWTVGRRDAALLAFRERLFGPRLSALADCPRCSETLEMEFPVSSITEGGPTGEDERRFVLEAEGYRILYRLPTAGDLAELGRTGAAGRWLLERCLVSAEPREPGPRPAPLDAAGPVWQALEAALARTVAECDPQAEIELALTCPACSLDWQTQFDIVGFLWREIDAWAGRMLREVHLLARAYRWSERDILALSAWRRQHYLELIRE